MDVRIVDYPIIDGSKDIIIDGKHHIITKEHFEDYNLLGKTIYVEYNRYLPLDKMNYKSILDKINNYIGIKSYNDRLTIETSIHTTGNVICINVLRRISGIHAGGFIAEHSSDYMLNEIDDILFSIKKMAELDEHEK